MRTLQARRPSAAMVSLSGNRLRRHTLTGAQINLKKLGTVPRAGSAGYAGNAGYAVNATNATDATNASHAATADSATTAANAGNASSLGGRPASDYLTGDARVGTNGIVKEGDATGGATATLFTHGPFTVTMTCTRASNGDTSLEIDASTSEANSDVNGQLSPAPGSRVFLN